MAASGVLQDQTVLVKKRKVVEVGPADWVKVPSDAAVIDGTGRFLLPGLIDAHVHVREKELEAYVAAGVLTVRNMWGYPRLRAIQHDVKTGVLVGPVIHSLSPGLDAPPGQWPLTQFVGDPRQADSVVAVQDGEGWKTIKIYQMLSRDAFDSIVASARRRGLRYAGHVPTAVPVEHALGSGMTTIEHLSGYDQAVSKYPGARGNRAWAGADPARYSKLAGLTAERGVWNCPTLAINAFFAREMPSEAREKSLHNMRKFVGVLHRQGAKLVAGTDAGIDRVPAGSTIVDELKEFEASGLSRYEALRTATVNGGELLGQPKLGTIVAGAPAELILLRGNPLDDLDALRTVEGVLHLGTWTSAKELAAH
jgi:imidazolonepropionase-like amidohydrolase